MNNIIFLKPYLEEKVWGSDSLKNYNIDLKNKTNVGEAWIISGIQNKETRIKNEEYNNMTLQEFYSQYHSFFGNYPDKSYPLLVKLLDCHDDLSIQVHPTDEYANNHKEYKTKNEAWYVLSAKKNAKIVYGHKAKTIEELKSWVNKGEWSNLLSYENVKADDLIYVPSGTIHALTKDLLIYEVQQTSDTTFRLYDYDRQLKTPGRKLNVQEAIDNITIPFVKPQLEKLNNELLTTPYFSISKIVNNGEKHSYDFSQAYWLQCLVIDGEGIINTNKIKKGDCFLLDTNTTIFELSGKITILISYIRK